ncbi:MAG: cupredoxin domain-containing protein [Actinomycetota bacterium]|nr:cupredoxin domain-containing protein [Actinomycetota bacterium]
MRRWGSGSRALLGVTAVLLVLATACSKSSNPSTTSAPPPTSPTDGTSTQTLEQGPGGKLVFDPATFSVKTGDTITVSNVGSVQHTFTITGEDVDVTNSPGASQDVTIDLAPGTYPFICRFHQSSGMKGTLTVTG